jgi:hypothetical protein
MVTFDRHLRLTKASTDYGRVKVSNQSAQENVSVRLQLNIVCLKDRQ